MPLLRYLLAVGTALTAALFAASTYLESQAPSAAARVSVSPTTASLYIPPPPAKPVTAASATAASLSVTPPPVKPSKKTRH
jgi:hypothetical protein